MSGNSHGHTLAGWTGATIIFIGFCVGGVFMVLAEPIGFWVGIVIIVLGGVVGLVMRLMGLGMPLPEKKIAVGARTSADG
ncbi:HGxxPAAW family protein [Streptomyces sp. SL13]|uniref:HGxxPAAW family protein n=1 Tax=Streptantibioticus silvisoli TaxID=2705255 RepID=A0AA90GY22_9ACTN|nr:HGxxPAAW family protein [Streptantibioticus silvisoli]MDI5970293.1 HGxxPAAW family protein [Streptantibioticus silvisoli]